MIGSVMAEGTTMIFFILNANVTEWATVISSSQIFKLKHEQKINKGKELSLYFKI
jgi:hypothetical protein